MRLLFVVELREGVDMRVVRYVAIVAVFVGFWINAVSAMPLVDSSDLNQIAIDQESSFTPTNDISAETGTKIIQSSETPITDGATLIVPKKDAVLQSAEIIPPVFIDDSAQKGYSLHTAKEDLSALKWDGGLAFAGITAIGVKGWAWGTAPFHFHSEGWCGLKTSSGCTDKFGHAFTSYTLTGAFAERLKSKGRNDRRAAISGFLLTEALMLYVETFDGISKDHGFSYEDLTANFLGGGLAYWREVNPKVKDLIDYRMEYKPSGYKGGFMGGFRPMSDYAGQKYVLALKLAGVDSLKKTPLKYFELQGGYYARGFTDAERALNLPLERTTFVGVGINLSELLFGSRDKGESTTKQVGRFFFDHIQMPYTYVRTNHQF